jgi:hypothetical protein
MDELLTKPSTVTRDEIRRVRFALDRREAFDIYEEAISQAMAELHLAMGIIVPELDEIFQDAMSKAYDAAYDLQEEPPINEDAQREGGDQAD